MPAAIENAPPIATEADVPTGKRKLQEITPVWDHETAPNQYAALHAYFRTHGFTSKQAAENANYALRQANGTGVMGKPNMPKEVLEILDTVGKDSDLAREQAYRKTGFAWKTVGYDPEEVIEPPREQTAAEEEAERIRTAPKPAPGTVHPLSRAPVGTNADLDALRLLSDPTPASVGSDPNELLALLGLQ